MGVLIGVVIVALAVPVAIVAALGVNRCLQTDKTKVLNFIGHSFHPFLNDQHHLYNTNELCMEVSKNQ